MSINIWAVVGTVTGFIPVTALTGTAGQIFAMNDAGTVATWKNWKIIADQLQGPAGSVGAPALAFEGDLSTGWYRPSALEWAFSVNGVQELLMNNGGMQVKFPLIMRDNLVMADAGADIVAAATTDLAAATGNSLSITHAAGILAVTGFGADTLPAGTIVHTKFVIAGGTLSLTHSFPEFVLLGGGNINLQNGDWATWRKTNDASPDWEMIGFQRGASSGVFTNKGDWLLGAGGGATTILPLGGPGLSPVVDSSQTSGVVWSYPTLPGFLWGCELANNAGDPNNDIDIATGVATADDFIHSITLGVSSITKRIDASWVVGTNQGGLDGTESVASTPDINTWYHVWLIKRLDTGVVDVLFSESATAPTMPANYTVKRRIGAVFNNGAGNIDPFLQTGGWFTWATPATTYNGVAQTGAAALGLLVPTGVKVLAQISAVCNGNTNESATHFISYYPIGATARAPGALNSQIITVSVTGTATGHDANTFLVMTNTGGQIVHDADSVNVDERVNTEGWYDFRGQV